ncbi:MAG: regulator of sigma E protease [Candidatus Berkelbacteria bacterium Licking1014_7]|uniref:Regulator of sigma E protease n=1 Tax=Candidatus Berkelbacteria bacterium Licking1014_7 TaxID=2017147 RepID=A0A554LI42_9BACT|nr:MAG: regulator of sigma E protease [Candidatus Berkelbacteria bacterium Licking1014_7]
MLITTIIVFILILGLLIFTHEVGHFWVARLVGIKVEEFAFGFPPRLWSRVKNGTRYAINLLPLGGYVKLLGEERESKNPASYSQKKPGQRLLVAVAGVFMNLVLTWILLAMGFLVGMTPLVSDIENMGGTQEKIMVISVLEAGGAAERQGVKPLSQIVRAKFLGQTLIFQSVGEVTDFTRSHKGQAIELELKNLSTGEVYIKNIELDDDDTPLGAGITATGKVKMGFLDAVKWASIELYKVLVALVVFIGSFFKMLFTEGKVAGEGVGPVGLFVITSQAVKLGFAFVLQLTALISINLAIINILPFPALDGGRALFILLEAGLGRKIVKEQVENIIHSIGFILLLALIVLITYRDIVRFF